MPGNPSPEDMARRARKDPEPSSELQRAVIQALDHFLAELRDRGEVATQARLAEILGVQASHLSAAKHGRSLTVDLLYRWGIAFSEHGYTGIRVVIEGQMIAVEPASKPR